MNLVDFSSYDNKFLQSVDIRCKLHDIFIDNRYGFTSIFMNFVNNNETIRNRFQLLNECPNICVGPFENMPTELIFKYSLKDHGLDNILLDRMDSIMYIDILQTMSKAIIDTIDYVYNKIHEDGGYLHTDEDLDIIFNFVQELKQTTKSAVTMLFDMRIYPDQFIIQI